MRTELLALEWVNGDFEKSSDHGFMAGKPSLFELDLLLGGLGKGAMGECWSH